MNNIPVASSLDIEVKAGKMQPRGYRIWIPPNGNPFWVHGGGGKYYGKR
jgi:hypothetical protein